MDSVVLDTNVLLDFLMETRPGHTDTVLLFDQLGAGGVATYVVATSLKDLYYITGRLQGKEAAHRSVESLLATMGILPVDEHCCRWAFACDEPDFEDGIIRAAAEIARVDYIISRDASAFVGSLVPRLSPAEALRELNLRP